MTLNIRQVAAERERARKFWAGLAVAERWQLGDELVLGCVDWWAWFDGRRPSRAFLDEVDRLRVEWEIAGS